MWLIGWHYHHFTSPQAKRFARNNNLCFTIKEVNQGVKSTNFTACPTNFFLPVFFLLCSILLASLLFQVIRHKPFMPQLVLIHSTFEQQLRKRRMDLRLQIEDPARLLNVTPDKKASTTVTIFKGKGQVL